LTIEQLAKRVSARLLQQMLEMKLDDQPDTQTLKNKQVPGQ